MTERRRNPPVQKALPLAHWPKADRQGWRCAQEGAGPLDDGMLGIRGGSEIEIA